MIERWYRCSKCDTYDVRRADEKSDMFKDPRCENCNGKLSIT